MDNTENQILTLENKLIEAYTFDDLDNTIIINWLLCVNIHALKFNLTGKGNN